MRKERKEAECFWEAVIASFKVKKVLQKWFDGVQEPIE